MLKLVNYTINMVVKLKLNHMVVSKAHRELYVFFKLSYQPYCTHENLSATGLNPKDDWKGARSGSDSFCRKSDQLLHCWPFWHIGG